MTALPSSGKSAKTENFPVGSLLIPAALRPHVHSFYAFARTIDDIADSPDVSPNQKIDLLEAFAYALTSGSDEPHLATAAALRRSMILNNISVQHGLDLISAFKQDAVKTRYASWAELIDYCHRSAAPVGRYLLDLHGETRECYPASDALCNALQVINHLQDCGDDRRTLDRVYLPMNWMHDRACAVDLLDASSTAPPLRQVLDLCLDHTLGLMQTAQSLATHIKHRHLAAEAAAIIAIAHKLIARLRTQDPLAKRVKLNSIDLIGAGVAGIRRMIWA